MNTEGEREREEVVVVVSFSDGDSDGGGGTDGPAHGSTTDICYRMTSFSLSTHLSFGVASQYGVHLPAYVPNMYYYREQINSLSTRASVRRGELVGKRRLVLVGLSAFARADRRGYQL